MARGQLAGISKHKSDRRERALHFNRRRANQERQPNKPRLLFPHNELLKIRKMSNSL